MKKLAILLLFMSTNTLGVVPETGWWWNPKEPGRGFNIEHQDGTVFIATFIFDENGMPIWYTTSGNLVNSTITASMNKFNNGQCITCDFISPTSEIDGTGEFHFTTSRTGTFTWKGVQLPIERIDFKENRIGGSWLVGSLFSFISINISNVTSDSVDVEVFNFFGDKKNQRYVFTDSTIDDFTHMTALSKNGGDFFSSDFDKIYLFKFKGPNKIQGLSVKLDNIFRQEITNSDGRKAFLSSERFKEMVNAAERDSRVITGFRKENIVN